MIQTILHDILCAESATFEVSPPTGSMDRGTIQDWLEENNETSFLLTKTHEPTWSDCTDDKDK